MNRAAAGLLCLSLLCCRHEAPASSVVPPAPPAPAYIPPAPSGTIQEGLYRDKTLPFSAPVPLDWAAHTGTDGGPLRLSMQERASGVGIEILAVAGGTPAPLPRTGCAWTFVDAADHHYADLPEPVTIATCIPALAGEARVQSWGFVQNGVAWHVDLIAPPATLSFAADHAAPILRAARFGRPLGE